MTHQCNICCKTFKYNWQLQRHYSRKIKCKEPVNKNSELVDKVKEIDLELVETKESLKETNSKVEELAAGLHDNKYHCMSCFQTFAFHSSLIKHRNSGRCRARTDNIFIYERELNLQPLKEEHLKCKYCFKTYKTQSALSKHKTKGCRERDEYESDLRERVLRNRREAAQLVQHNNNTGDVNNNTIHIHMPPMNPFGKENLDYITTKLLIKELQKCKAIEQADVCGIVDRFTKLIHANPAHPENQNVLFKSLNSGFASVYTENGFQDQQATDVQDGIIQNVHKLIQTKGCDEYDYNECVNDTFADVLEDIDVNYGKMDENMKEGTNSRALGKCRNTVKAVLHSNKEEIGSTQNLIKN